MDTYVADPPRKRSAPVRTELDLEEWVADQVTGYDCEWDVPRDVAKKIIRKVRGHKAA